MPAACSSRYTYVERLAYLSNVFAGQAVVVPVETTVPEVAGSFIRTNRDSKICKLETSVAKWRFFQ